MSTILDALNIPIDQLDDQSRSLYTALQDAAEQIETLQQQLTDSEAELRFYKTLVDHAPEAIEVTTLDGTLYYANTAAQALYRCPEALAGQPLARFRAPQATCPDTDMCRHLFEQGTWYGSLQSRRADDTSFVAHVAATLLPDEQGEPWAIVSMHHECTDYSPLSDALSDSERWYRALVRRLPNTSVFLFDHQLRYLVVDGDDLPQRCRLNVSAVGKTIWEALPPDMVEQVLPLYRAALQGAVLMQELSFDERTYMFRTVPLTDEHENIIAGMVIANDITEQRRTEEALRLSEEKFRHFFEQSLDGIALIDDQGIVIDWNSGAEQIIGLRRDEVIGQPLWDIQYRVAPIELHNPQTYDMTRRMVQHLLATQQVLTSDQRSGQQIERPDGTRCTVQSMVFPIQTGEGVLFGSIIHDITELHQTEAALRQNIQFLQALLDTIPSPVFFKDIAGRYQDCNHLFAAHVLGVSKDQLIGRKIHELPNVIPPDLARLYDEHDQYLINNPGMQMYEAPVICASGQQRDFLFAKTLFRGTGDEVAGIVGVMLDITERRRIEHALRESEARLLAVMRNMPIVLFAFDTDGNCMLAEGRGLKAMGLGPGEAVGQHITTLLYRNSRAPHFFQHALEGSEVRWEVHGAQDEQFFEVALTPVRNNEGSVHEVIGVVMDISARKASEAQIQHLAFTDPLTGLANRRRLYDQGRTWLADADGKTPGLALVYLDLDRFKAVNDTMGHDAGDMLLVQVAGRLLSCIGQDGMLARIGGDEFALLLPHSTSANAFLIAQRMLEQISHPFYLRTQPVRIGGSFGITTSSHQTTSFSHLLTQADIAMYYAKAHDGGVQVYTPDLVDVVARQTGSA
jgi:diguanylate cyclase (GGDEF)-like protein/PAS domain S-box-containing protein